MYPFVSSNGVEVGGKGRCGDAVEQFGLLGACLLLPLAMYESVGMIFRLGKKWNDGAGGCMKTVMMARLGVLSSRTTSASQQEKYTGNVGTHGRVGTTTHNSASEVGAILVGFFFTLRMYSRGLFQLQQRCNRQMTAHSDSCFPVEGWMRYERFSSFFCVHEYLHEQQASAERLVCLSFS